MSVVIPERVGTVLTAEVAREIAANSDHPVFPGQVCIDEVGQPNRRFPDYPGPMLVLVHENQYVCSWGVPLGDPDPPVLVGGSVLDRVRSTVRYSANIDAFVAARRWDGRCLCQGTLLQAGTVELSDESDAFLRTSYNEQPETHGWPLSVQRRFERDAVHILLHSSPVECWWWISAPNSGLLEPTLRELMELPELRSLLWSNDDAGIELLQRVGIWRREI